MRASRVRGMREEHISGAEGLVSADRVISQMTNYLRRATVHPRGAPDMITVTIEKLASRPKNISALPLRTLRCRSTDEARSAQIELLRSCGVSDVAVRAALSILSKKRSLRGAALLDMNSGQRLDANSARGVRASRLGISKEASISLSRRLGRFGINTTTVKEALVLASKVAACAPITAELCVSDDPDYSTGYCASRQWGYVRIPHMKKKNDPRGGRIFFVKSGTNLKSVLDYLERTPVLITGTAPVSGITTLDELFGHRHR